MSESKLSPSSDLGPESPTTARPLEMDDDDPHDDDKNTPHSNPSGGGSDAPPPELPRRPITEAERNFAILKEAFPSIDGKVIKAVLSASGGRIELAFNALLEMTDPDVAAQNATPPPPSSTTNEHRDTATPRSQLEADELFARQLAEQFDNSYAYEARTANPGSYASSRPRLRPAQRYYDDDDQEYNFLEDELPQIKENLRKGFLETQTKFNTWLTNMKKKIDEQFDDDEGQDCSSLSTGLPMRDPRRRSADYDKYDADPELLSDDFAGIKFHGDGSLAPNERPNPSTSNLTGHPGKAPQSDGRRKVAFRTSIEELGSGPTSQLLTNPGSTANTTGGGKSSRWQPLATAEPDPISENDPFILGDSEDEKEAKDKSTDSPRTKRDGFKIETATAEAMADELRPSGFPQPKK